MSGCALGTCNPLVKRGQGSMRIYFKPAHPNFFPPPYNMNQWSSHDRSLKNVVTGRTPSASTFGLRSLTPDVRRLIDSRNKLRGLFDSFKFCGLVICTMASPFPRSVLYDGCYECNAKSVGAGIAA